MKCIKFVRKFLEKQFIKPQSHKVTQDNPTANFIWEKLSF